LQGQNAKTSCFHRKYPQTLNVRRLKLFRLVKKLKIKGIKQHLPCKTCSDPNPDLFKGINASVNTKLAKAKESKESGCQFCRLVYESDNHY
jgi:hypothetical protein